MSPKMLSIVLTVRPPVLMHHRIAPLSLAANQRDHVPLHVKVVDAAEEKTARKENVVGVHELILRVDVGIQEQELVQLRTQIHSAQTNRDDRS